MRLIFASVFALATACSASAPEGCGFEAPATFRSVEEGECGLGPDGVVMCQWTVSFAADGTFSWMYSDLGDSGTWSCSEGELSAQRGGGQAISVSFDAGTGVLTWDGVAYTEG
jgi:hypothetical protein